MVNQRSMRNSECGIPNSELRTFRARRPLKGQASIEMALAFVGTLLLLFGTLRVFMWMNSRILTREQDYDNTRVDAGSSLTYVDWNESRQPLRIFK